MSQPTPLSSRERLRRVFGCQPTDRMPIRLWGVDPMFPYGSPTWEPLYEMTERYQLDIIRSWAPAAEERDQPVVHSTSERRESGRPHLWEIETVLQTPAGPLTQIHCQPKDGGPGYVTKHYLDTVEDARRWLSIPQPAPQFRVDSYFDLEKKSGDRALLMVGLAEPMYSVQAMMGSETFGYWLMDERPLLHELVDRAYAGIEATAKRFLAHGVGDTYGWVGPELCIPPLASVRDFREFVFEYDRRIIDLVHDAGKTVWIHCHGDMSPVLEEFVAMGVDCLNPIEPPPIGKITLAQAKQRVAGRMCLEGGIEDGDFHLKQPDEMARITEDVVAQGKPGGGFILCPSSSPNTSPSLNDLQIANYRAFVETGIRLASYA